MPKLSAIPRSKYHEVSQDDIATEMSTLPSESGSQRTGRGLASKLAQAFPWILHLLLILAYSVMILRYSLPPSRKCFSEDLLNPPIVWEERTYMSNIDGGKTDIFSHSNPNVEEAWDSVLESSMMALTEEEVLRLPGRRRTAALQGQEGYAGILEVSHQLHCLNALRTQFYAGNSSIEQVAGFAEAGGHSDHCFSYLVQTLLCHADVGVMTTRYDERLKVYHANFDVTKQCRNYEVIHAWAKERKAIINTPER